MKKMKFMGLLTTILLLIVVAACSDDKMEEMDAQKSVEQEPATCKSDSATYTADVKPILTKYCISCHGATSSLRLNTYADVKAQVTSGRLMGSIRKQPGFNPMPPSGKLTNCDIAKIQNWIDRGALNN